MLTQLMLTDVPSVMALLLTVSSLSMKSFRAAPNDRDTFVPFVVDCVVISGNKYGTVTGVWSNYHRYNHGISR